VIIRPVSQKPGYTARSFLKDTVPSGVSFMLCVGESEI